MSTTPVNVQIPSDAEAPIIADFVEHALRVAYVDRSHLSALPFDDWATPGVYVLLTSDGSGCVYVGQARRLRDRLLQHNTKPKLPWSRAVAVKRDTTDGFNTAEIGYLEGRVSAELGALENVHVVEGQKSGDETLPKHMMISLDSFVKSILGAVRLAGVDAIRAVKEVEPDEEAEATNTNTITRTTYPGKLSDLVSSGLIAAGQNLYLSQAGREATASVTSNGEVLFNGVAFKTPSSAAATALGLQSSNGWTTWHVGSLSGPTLSHFRDQWQEQRRAATS